MLKNLMFLLFCFWILSAAAKTSAITSDKSTTTIGYTYVTVTNNTNEELNLQTTLTTNDTNFKRGKDWDGLSTMLAPYETKQMLWFSRNVNVKANQLYQFDLKAYPSNQINDKLTMSLSQKGKSIFGSEIKTELAFPLQSKQIILSQTEFEQLSSDFWNNRYTIHARKWLQPGNVFHDYHFVINKNENNSFDTASNDKISILTYNTQLMPFYVGVVDDLNQPKIRVNAIAKKITQYDIVILQELFDHDLRMTMINALQTSYPYHTQVAGHNKSKVLTGGVMIFSKWPIFKEDQTTYQASAGIDSLAAKGAVYAAINKNGKIYHIIGTHLQAEDSGESVSAREKQLLEIKNFIDYLAIPADQPLLIGGDFNIDQFSQELNILLNHLPVTLIDNIGHPYSFDATINTMNVGKRRKRLDYIFYSTGHIKPAAALNKVFILRDLDNEKMWPKFDLSDHFPVASYFDFSTSLR